MDDKPVEFYLASIWRYRDAGADRVLGALRKQHPGGQYSFEADESWFKASCHADDVRNVQAIFRQVHDEIEGDIKGNEIPTDNPWLKVPKPGELPKDTTRKIVVDQLCPVTFDRYNFRKVWTRVKTETPDTISVRTFLSEHDRQSIMASSGAHAAFDTGDRLVYLGGTTKESVATASKMLDNMFDRFVFVMPAPKHLMYAEAESQYRVDARFMAHVNDNMLTSTIFDPSQYPGKLLDSMFKAVFAKAACLRICVLDQFKRVEVSFFGPKVQPIFNDQARKWPTWFKRAEYTAKVLGVTAPKKATEAVQGAAPVQAPQPIQQPPSQTVPEGNEFVHVAECGTNEKAKIKETMGPGLSKQLDLLTLNLPCPEMSVASALQSALTPERPKAESERPYSPPVSPPSFESDKYGYQMKLLWDFVYSSARTGQDGSRPTSTAGAKAAATKGERNNDTAKSKINDAPAEAEPLISMLDDEAPSTGRAGTSTFGPDQDNLLIQIDAPPRSASPPLSEQLRPVPVPGEKPRSVLPIGTGMSKALVRRSTFASGLCNSIGRLMADLPYSRGRIRLQVELGRLYIMDADPEGLAYNAPGEAASGWPHTEIITRLDTICVSPESIVFTKALTLFANDIESVLGSNAVVPSRGIVGDGGDVFGGGSERSSTSSSEWTFHEKRIVYEFKCQRHFLTSTGVVKVQSPFVVEIDGTEAGAFTYNIRRVEDTRPPIWIHCIRRHWDARVTVSYSQTDKLEEVYGEFARELLRTMVVPPRPITCPKFQVAYDHRETEKDGRSFFTKVVSTRVRNVGRFVSDNKESFLDVSWNHHMALEMKPGKETAATGTIRATLAVDNPGRGLFTSWYEASVVSAVAETAFRENETLPVGGMAVWGSGGGGKQDELYEAAFGPALRLVQKMDGVGVLIDNGQGDVLWTPPVKADQAVLAVQKFW